MEIEEEKAPGINDIKAALASHVEAHSLTANDVKSIDWEQATQILERRDFSRRPVKHAVRRLVREMEQKALEVFAAQLQGLLRISFNKPRATCTAKYGPVMSDESGIKRHIIFVELEPPVLDHKEEEAK